MNVLYVCTEVYPLLKTGGLADVSAALSAALLSGLAVLMLGGWLSARRVQV